MQKILIIDNYDSFTYNLYQLVGEILVDIDEKGTAEVCRNDELTLEQIADKNFTHIIISPGPGNPKEKKYFGICGEVITKLGPSIPLLGVCLGMQGIAQCFGGQVVPAEIPKHGKTSQITHDEKGIFINLPQNLEAMRYHSLIVDLESLPDCLEISAYSKSGTGKKEIMAMRHKKFPIEGVQFHPESFASEGGRIMIKNFISKKI